MLYIFIQHSVLLSVDVYGGQRITLGSCFVFFLHSVFWESNSDHQVQLQAPPPIEAISLTCDIEFIHYSFYCSTKAAVIPRAHSQNEGEKKISKSLLNLPR